MTRSFSTILTLSIVDGTSKLQRHDESSVFGADVGHLASDGFNDWPSLAGSVGVEEIRSAEPCRVFQGGVRMPPTVRPRTAEAPGIFAWLADTRLTGVGVPSSLGGTGGDRADALGEVMRIQRTDPEAAAALASHQGVIGALLAGSNVALRSRIPELARGDVSGIWPSSAFHDMLHRGTAAVQARQAGGGARLSGPLGRIYWAGRHPIVLVCPVQWSAAHPPGIALLNGGEGGLHITALPKSPNCAPHTSLVSLEDVIFQTEQLIDADGSRIAMMVELQALHSTVTSWLERTAALDTAPSGAVARDDRR